MQIAWHSLDRQTYEDMVSVLLSRLHPDSQRIDGAGGDGGRDVQFEQSAGLQIFQLKSFHTRLTQSQRRQIKRSLGEASKFTPVQWHLVMPLDPSPSELDWFKGLERQFTFRLRWHGKTWLESQMADHPEIIRYFVEGASETVVKLLIELREEQALISTAHDAVKRMKSLHERLNELDPHFRYSLSIGDARAAATGAVLSVRHDDVRVDLFERYKGALQDRPITVGMTAVFGPDDAELQKAFIRSLDYGTSVTLPSNIVQKIDVDAPGGLGGTFEGAEIRLEAAVSKISGQAVHLEIWQAKQLLASLPVHFHSRTTGSVGGTLEGQDDTGWLRLDATINLETKRFNLTFHFAPRPVLPASLLPLLRWFDKFRPGNELRVRWSDELVTPATDDIPASLSLADELPLVEALAFIQESARVYFPMPLDLSVEEAGMIMRSHRLLRGDSITARWSSLKLGVTVSKREAYKGFFEPPGVAMHVQQDEILELRGHDLPIGRIASNFSSVRASKPSSWKKLRKGMHLSLELVPGDSSEVTITRVGL